MNSSAYTFTPEEFETAFDKASYWAKKRLFKKCNKVRFNSIWMAKSPDGKSEPGFYKVPRQCKDVDVYTSNFVALNLNKGK